MNETAGDSETQKLAEDLKALKAATGGLMKECVVAFDVVHSENSYDLSLNSLFDNLQDLEKYRVHPEHVKVVEKIKKLCSSAAKIDYKE
jgi:hypothetical protein